MRNLNKGYGGCRSNHWPVLSALWWGRTDLVKAYLLAGLIMLAGQSVLAQQASPADLAQKKAPASGGEQSKAAPNAPEPPVGRSGSGAPQKPAVDTSTVWQLVFHANPMLWPLAICSVVTLGYVLERWLALRRDNVVPREFADRFLERLSSGKLDRERALELCRAHESFGGPRFSRWWWGRGGSRELRSGRWSVTTPPASCSSSSEIFET